MVSFKYTVRAIYGIRMGFVKIIIKIIATINNNNLFGLNQLSWGKNNLLL